TGDGVGVPTGDAVGAGSGVGEQATTPSPTEAVSATTAIRERRMEGRRGTHRSYVPRPPTTSPATDRVVAAVTRSPSMRLPHRRSRVTAAPPAPRTARGSPGLRRPRGPRRSPRQRHLPAATRTPFALS